MEHAESAAGVDVTQHNKVYVYMGVYVGRGTWRERRRTRNGKRGTRGEENGRREDRGSAEAHTTTAIRPPLHPIDDNDDDDDVAATSSIILISTINVRPSTLDHRRYREAKCNKKRGRRKEEARRETRNQGATNDRRQRNAKTKDEWGYVPNNEEPGAPCAASQTKLGSR